MFENDDLFEQVSPHEARDIPASVLAGALLNKILPDDRAATEDTHKAPLKLPGAANLKDLPAGPVGVAKGIIVDNSKQIFGAQPLGKADQPVQSLDVLIDAASAVAPPKRTGRFPISDIDNWPADVRRGFLMRLATNDDFRAQVASTPEGRALILEREIALTARDNVSGAIRAVTLGVAPKKKGGAAGIARPAKGKGGAVADDVTQLDRLFAANPPDP